METAELGKSIIKSEKQELNWFMIEDAYGGNQDWMIDEWMNKGGCGALTACDSCIYFARERQEEDKTYTDLYPYDCGNLTKADYIRFGDVMKPYLAPRRMGINTLEIYMDGFKEYLDAAVPEPKGEAGDRCRITMSSFPGTRTLKEAKAAVRKQIDKKLPIPCLILRHKSPNLEDYVWHWFLLIGYEEFEEDMMVKAVTYGEYRWISLAELWDTGYEEKGGLVLYEVGY